PTSASGPGAVQDDATRSRALDGPLEIADPELLRHFVVRPPFERRRPPVFDPPVADRDVARGVFAFGNRRVGRVGYLQQERVETSVNRRDLLFEGLDLVPHPPERFDGCLVATLRHRRRPSVLFSLQLLDSGQQLPSLAIEL